MFPRFASVGMLVGALLLSMLSTAHAKQEDQHGADPEIILLFMFFGLAIGILIMQLLSFCGDPLPYTVVIFMSGLVFSLLDKNNAGKLLVSKLITLLSNKILVLDRLIWRFCYSMD